MASFTGKYERVSAENYDELLKELDVGFLLRKAATASSPTLLVSKEGDVWTFKTSTTLKSMELKFELGKEFDETTADGREVTSLVTMEGDNKFISVQTAKKEGQKSTKTVREFKDGECIQTIQVVGSDLVCKQVFKKV